RCRARSSSCPRFRKVPPASCSASAWPRCWASPSDGRPAMKICIYGAGAIGGLLGTQLARAGEDVTLIARGAHLAAMREKGLTLRIDGQEHNVRVAATDNPAEAGPQDFVIVTVKAHGVADVAEAMQPLL